MCCRELGRVFLSHWRLVVQASQHLAITQGEAWHQMRPLNVFETGIPLAARNCAPDMLATWPPKRSCGVGAWRYGVLGRDCCCCQDIVASLERARACLGHSSSGCPPGATFCRGRSKETMSLWNSTSDILAFASSTSRIMNQQATMSTCHVCGVMDVESVHVVGGVDQLRQRRRRRTP